MTRPGRRDRRSWPMPPRRLGAVTTCLALMLAAALAQAPPFTEGTVVIDAADCTPARAQTFHGLGSGQVAVFGHDADGACVVEALDEVEGGFAHRVCRLPAELPAFEWTPGLDDPSGLAVAGALDHCETVTSGSYFWPDQEDPSFPRTAWPE